MGRKKCKSASRKAKQTPNTKTPKGSNTFLLSTHLLIYLADTMCPRTMTITTSAYQANIDKVHSAIKKLKDAQKKRVRELKRVMKLMVKEIVDLQGGNTNLCRCAKTTIYTECNENCLSLFVAVESDKDDLSNAREIDERISQAEEKRQRRKTNMMAKLAAFNRAGIVPPNKIIIRRRTKYSRSIPRYKMVGCGLKINTDV